MIQYLCKEAIDLAALDLDFASFSAHKLAGHQGWAHYIAGQAGSCVTRGGGQEQNRRAGTENLPGIVGFGAAMAACNNVATGSQTIWRDKAGKDIITACPEIEVMALTHRDLPIHLLCICGFGGSEGGDDAGSGRVL